MLPADLQLYLSTPANLKHRFDQGEVTRVTLYAANKVPRKTFVVDTYDFYLNGELTKDLDQRFEFEGLDLVKDCAGYSPEGILIWFPSLKAYGSWDCDHERILLYPNLTWTDISMDLGRFLNAQWYPESVAGEYLRPWKKKRKA